MKRLFASLCAALMLTASSAAASTVAYQDIADPLNPLGVAVAPGVNVTPLARADLVPGTIPGFANAGYSNRGRGFALNNDKFFGFTLSVPTGIVDIDQATFSSAVAGSGPTVELIVAADGVNAFNQTFAKGANAGQFTVDLSSLPVAQEYTFRFYGYDAASGAEFALTDTGDFGPTETTALVLDGVAAVPLPAGMVLLLTGLGAAVVLRRRAA